MDKKPSYLWALAAAALFAILQAVILLVRTGSMTTGSPLSDYLIYFLAGALIGVGLVYLLRRSETPRTVRGTIVGFVIGMLFALFGMIVGGMVGGIGVLFLSVSPALFFTGVGYFIGRAFSKK